MHLRIYPAKRLAGQCSILVVVSNGPTTVGGNDQASQPRLLLVVARVDRDEASRWDERRRGQREHLTGDVVGNVVDDTVRQRYLEPSQLSDIVASNIRDEEAASGTPAGTSVLDVPLALIETHVLDVRKVIEDVGGAAADVEKAIAGLWS